MKRVFLAILAIYVCHGRALSVDILQADSLISQVRRGLNPEDPPAALASAWDSTFLLLFLNPKPRADEDNARVGSAFVVAREIDGDEQTLDLLTADHVLTGYCDESKCNNLMIFPNGVITTDGASAWRKASSPLPSPNVRVIARNPRDDLALIRISTNADLAVEPLDLAAGEARPGERVYPIGYPKVFLRRKSKDPEPNVIRRRWSQGEVMGVVNYGRLLAGTYLTTDADALPGNSGGPVLNARGEVVGVLGLTGGQAATGFAYVDSPDGANEGIQGAAIRLARVRAFLNWVN